MKYSHGMTCWGLALALAAGPGCDGDDEPASDPCHEPGPADACHDADPAKAGMFPVGVTTVVLEDPDRPDERGEPRRLKVEIWYPAAPEARDLPRDVYDMNAEATPAAAAMLQDVTFPPQEQDAARDARLDERYAPYPLLVFSHGMGGIRFQTFTLMIHLASHGYVVAAPDHTDDTIWDLMVNGFNAGHTPDLIVKRPNDVSFVGGRMAAADGPLGAVVDGRWGVFGHSFGGLTSILVTATTSEFYDARFDAMLPMAPASGPAAAFGYGTDHAGVPLLIMGGLLDDTCPYETEQVALGYDIAPPPRGLVGILQAGHFSFTELCELDLASVAVQLELDVDNVLEDGCGPVFVEPQMQRRIQNYFAAAFFNRYLRGNQAAAVALHPDNIPEELSLHLEYEQEGIAP